MKFQDLKVLNNPFAFCFLQILIYFLPHTARFDDKNGLPSLAFNTFEFILSVFFFYTLNNKSAYFII